MPLFDWAWSRLHRAARSQPYANNGAAAKRLRGFVHSMLRAEVGK
jgi:hypothetical protein